MSRALLVVLVAAVGASTGCSSGERSCRELRAELQQVTGGTSVDVNQWSDLEEESATLTRALQLREEIDRRCG